MSEQSKQAFNLPKLLILGAVSLSIIGLILLGNWQLRRLDWKLALIERIESRVSAAATIAPKINDWPSITRKADEYRHITIQGRFLHDKEALVWALTEHGNGYWVITPLLTPDSEIVLINRGYVPIEAADTATRESGQINGNITVTGLLRINEPDGITLRKNEPSAEHWYSRDIFAIAQTRELKNVAPYFVDADDTKNPGGLPVGGLTIIDFRNTHLIYAISWYALAILLAAMTLRVLWLERRSQKIT